VLNRSEVVVLAVKPQQVAPVLAELQQHLRSEHLIVSIAAGVTLHTLHAGLGAGCRLVRVMPNSPCLVGTGASAFVCGPHATPADAELVSALLSTVGIAVPVPESQMDAVTGLSGSGPAYVFQMIEALSDGGVRVGLPRDVSTKLAAQTVLGAARMVLETGEHPAALKDAVASPGGTTIAGLHAMERAGVRAGLMDAVQEATVRSIELGRS
jgi:pyrroline-5-carboxylate reductase